MRQWNEMAILTEPVHHGQYDRLATDARERFNEVEGDFSSNPLGHRKGKQEASWVQVLGLVSLADDARAHQVLNKLLHVRKMKVAAQSVQRALDSFMSILMDSGHDLLNEGGHRGNV